MSNLNQKQFDQKFGEIVVGQMAHEKLAEHEGNFGSMEPRSTSINTTCNHCSEDVDVNALYHPGDNAMHYRCPECKKTNVESNWFDRESMGRMKSPFTNEIITPKNLNNHLSKPYADKPKAPTWKQVQSAKWDKDGEPDDGTGCKHKNIREMYDGTKACTNCYKKF